MPNKTRTLNLFSPLPPLRNGIADYSAMLIPYLTQRFNVRTVSPVPAQHIAGGTEHIEFDQFFRYYRAKDICLYQIGNNPDHQFVIKALREYGGVTTIHDQNLIYLYETMGQSEMTRRYYDTSTTVAHHFGRLLIDDGKKNPLQYHIFDALGEVITLSDAVIVHSEFARDRIMKNYEGIKERKLHVIPHFCPPDTSGGYREARARLV